jgi:cell division protease FtsH
MGQAARTEQHDTVPGGQYRRGPAGADVAVLRERRRRQRLRRLAAVVAVLVAWVAYRAVTHQPVGVPQLPQVDPMYLMSGAFFLVLILTLVATTVASGRSPHVMIRPEQVDVRMDDVKGLAAVTEDVRRSLDLFLAGRTFRREMGGTPRRGLLFEGPPGTGKTYLAKAMAAEAGVPFLFVSATAFQSMYYGATARKIRSYFAALRKVARAEGGAIGFIEEIDAIATVRGGMLATPAPALGFHPAASWRSGRSAWTASAAECGGLAGLPSFGGRVVSGAVGPFMAGAGVGAGAFGALGGGIGGQVVHRAAISEGVGGVVNELLVQMQSFDTPTRWQQVRGAMTDAVNRLLPAHRQIPAPRPEPVDILLIAATNRADNLDPALLRPGRFDRRLVFDAPDKAGRRELVDHFLARKAHAPALDDDERRDALAGVTQGYTPVMIEHLLDEALVNAIRRGDTSMTWADVEHARLVTEVGLGQPVHYTEHEQQLIATHEAGHAVLAWLVAPHRRLEILTIVKRGGALGLLAHGDREDVYTRSRSELLALIQIAFGGQAAEEVFFGDITTGPGGDLRYATNVAVQMVGQAGMSDTLISYAAAHGSPFGGDLVERVLSDGEGRRMVEEVLREQKDIALELLAANRHLVAALRDALIERHELIGHEITDVLQQARDEHAAHSVSQPGAGAVADGVAGGVAGGPVTVVDLREGAARAEAHRRDGEAGKDGVPSTRPGKSSTRPGKKGKPQG